MDASIRIAILDDHQPIIDGITYRLRDAQDIQVCFTLLYGAELEATLKQNPVDVLLMDLQVPISSIDPNPYPVIHVIPRLLQSYPGLAVMVISMHAQPAMIQAVMQAGASGYILKDDVISYRELPFIIRNVAYNGIHLSPAAENALHHRHHLELDKPLSARQLEVLSLYAAYPDATTTDIACQMSLAHSTVRNLLSTAYLKLNVRSRAAAVLRAQQLHIIPGPTSLVSLSSDLSEDSES